jgi:hypothetical protein
MMKTVVVTRASSGIGFSVSEGVVQGLTEKGQLN